MKLCKLTCPNCGGTLKMEITKNNTQVCCPYCRQEFYFDNEKKEYNVNVNKKVSKKYINVAETIRARTEAKESKILIIIMIMCIIIFLSPYLFFNVSAKIQGKVNAGNYEDLKDKDYKTVEAHFKSAGFTNIDLIDLNDAGLAFWNDGKVDTISIGGNNKFGSYDWFQKDIKVVISYH